MWWTWPAIEGAPGRAESEASDGERESMAPKSPAFGSLSMK